LATEGASPPFDVRSVIETVSGALRATPTLRAADATVGTALIALGVRRHHSTSAAVVVGVHAIDLALGQRVTGKRRALEIRPDIRGDRLVITVRRTIGGAR
jgi:hypothetical protein